MNSQELNRILEQAPDDEPARQYFFAAQCARIISELKEQKGKPLTCRINTFGCQMNARDSEKLLGILRNTGFEESAGDDADLVLFNTCTVRENANERFYGRLGTLKSLKKANPSMIVALCGCMMQEPHVIEKIRTSYSHVNIIFGTHNIYKLAELLFMYLATGKNQIQILEEAEKTVEELPAVRKYRFKSGVNIMFGCNNFCSYCIVPYVRGRERSRDYHEILAEIKSLSEDGVKEIMLLGQNVNSYKGGVPFPELLEMAANVNGIERVRFMTSHPKDLSDDLIDVISKNPVICRHIHLPLQSGSTRILKEMNRHYSREDYLSLAGRIRERIPDVSITTDLIVGFPGETMEDFLETMDMVEKVRFDSAFTFIYSKRSGTRAAQMPDQISKEEVDERFRMLLDQVTRISKEQTLKFRGRIMDVLVDEINQKDPELLTGRLSNNSVVHFKGDPELVGSIVNVHLDEAKGFYYYGTLADDVSVS